jgi:predicted site-specific integrase-resolvase
MAVDPRANPVGTERAAELLGVKNGVVRHMLKSDQLPHAWKEHGHWRIPIADVIEIGRRRGVILKVVEEEAA